MKAGILLALGAVSVAASHNHHHHALHHVVRRDVATTVEVVPGPTVVVYMLNGQPVSASDAKVGLDNGSLVFVDGSGKPIPSGPQGAQFFVKPSAASVDTPSAAVATPTPSPAAPTTSAAAAAPAAPSSAAAPAAPQVDITASGVNADFPDGQLDCSTFPSQYGAVAAPYLNMNGWIGLQYVTIAGNFVNHIVTGIAGNTCTEGAMCSYACPPGYQKSQWPSTQGATGQSIGGIVCQGGKLRLTNPGFSTKLCIPGMGGVQVRNTLGQNVAICRTDYPGTESETVPTNVNPGQTQELTNPNGNTYYQHQGAVTSAQYYINPAGMAVSDACWWNTPGSNAGNFAPLNLGVGYRDGKTWVSIFQNAPTNTDGKLDYTIELLGTGGAVLGGSCKYSHGTWSGSAATANGCTVGVDGGTVIYQISA